MVPSAHGWRTSASPSCDQDVREERTLVVVWRDNLVHRSIPLYRFVLRCQRGIVLLSADANCRPRARGACSIANHRCDLRRMVSTDWSQSFGGPCGDR